MNEQFFTLNVSQGPSSDAHAMSHMSNKNQTENPTFNFEKKD